MSFKKIAAVPQRDDPVSDERDDIALHPVDVADDLRKHAVQKVGKIFRAFRPIRTPIWSYVSKSQQYPKTKWRRGSWSSRLAPLMASAPDPAWHVFGQASRSPPSAHCSPLHTISNIGRPTLRYFAQPLRRTNDVSRPGFVIAR